MLQPSDDWDEFDWERALRDGDDFAHRYFRLLRRFCDLPGSNELIARHLGPEFDAELHDCDFDCDTCANRWECDFGAAADWQAGDAEDAADASAAEAGEDGEPAGDGDESLFYESDPTFILLRQAAIGWCNIYAAILPAEARPLGLRALFHIGRAVANFVYSLEEGTYDQSASGIAFAKRSLAHVNLAVGLLNQLMQEKPRLKKILVTIRGHLMRANQALIDHLQRCRREAGPQQAT